MCNPLATSRPWQAPFFFEVKPDFESTELSENMADRWFAIIFDLPAKGPKAISPGLAKVFEKLTYAEVLFGHSDSEPNHIKRLWLHAQAGGRVALIITRLSRKKEWGDYLRQHVSAVTAFGATREAEE